MKNFLLCLVLSILTISCSQDSDLGSKTAGKGETNTKKLSPENPFNTMDYKGKRYYDALQDYYMGNKSPHSIEQMTNYLNFTSGSISPANPTSRGVIPFTDEWVESIMSDPDNSLITIVQNSTLSSEAQNNVISFLQDLLTQRGEQFIVQCTFIVSYENDLIDNTTLLEDEKETLLTVASISRYSLYSESERKDRDWETSVGSKPSYPFLKPDEAATITIIALLKKVIN